MANSIPERENKKPNYTRPFSTKPQLAKELLRDARWVNTNNYPKTLINDK